MNHTLIREFNANIGALFETKTKSKAKAEMMSAEKSETVNVKMSCFHYGLASLTPSAAAALAAAAASSSLITWMPPCDVLYMSQSEPLVVFKFK